MDRTKTCIGYVYDREVDGVEDYSYRYFFNNTAEHIARFICTNYHHKVIITDELDRLICSSVPGGYLDNATDVEYLRTELLPQLARYQLNQETAEPIKFDYDEGTGQFVEKE